MKAGLKLVLRLSLLLLAPGSFHAAAYYDPSFQRWLNRDPINDSGFDLFDYPRAARMNYHGGTFSFAGNSPGILIDPLGLKVWPGKSCKGSGDELKKMMDGFLARCKQAQAKGCFACLKDNAPKMGDPCDPNKFGDVVVECENKSATGCTANKLKGGTGCGWTDDAPNPDYPGKNVVHVCMGLDKATGCSDTGCTLLHEVAHAAGGVGPDSKDNRAYDIEECAGCE
jgi:hypothetical protein